MMEREAETHSGPVKPARKLRKHPVAEQLSLSMRDLTKLTAEDVATLEHPLPVTSNGLPIAWLVPLTPGERRRAEMIAAGRLRPRKRYDFSALPLLPAMDDGGPTLSEILLEMRAQERT